MAAPADTRLVPPGTSRAGSRPPGNVGSSILAVAGSVLVVALLWASLVFYDGTLGVTGTRLAVARVVEIAVAVTGLAVVGAAAKGFLATLRARRLWDAGQREEARVAADVGRSGMWWAGGLGLTALIVTFLFVFFGANDGAVRQTFFD